MAKIVSITTAFGHTYTLGESPGHLPEDNVVEKIVFNRPEKVYNGGFQTSQSGYTIFFADSTIRRHVQERHAPEVAVDTTKEENESKKVIPDLPDSNQKAADAE